MRMESAVKIIIVLLCILIVSVGAMLILTKNQGEEETSAPEATTAAPTVGSSTEEPNVSTTDEEPITTTPPVTTPELTVPDTTVPPETTLPPVVPPMGDVPEDFAMERTFRSESGTYLNLRAELTAVVEDGNVKVTVSLYLEHYSLFLGARSGGYLSIGDDRSGFVSPKIALEENVKSSTLLVTHIAFFEYGDQIALNAYFPCRCTYGSGENAVTLDTLAIEETVTLKA